MWIQKSLLMLLGISSGFTAAGGLFGFIVELGVIADFADRTHTGEKIKFYEDCIAAGGITGTILSLFPITFHFGTGVLTILGLASGIFVGCWAMALAEILNVYPIFSRRLKVVKYVGFVIVSIALGKGIGALLILFYQW